MNTLSPAEIRRQTAELMKQIQESDQIIEQCQARFEEITK